MKLFIVLALAIVAVSGKSLRDGEYTELLADLEKDLHGVNDVIKKDPQRTAEQSMNFLAGVDPVLRRELMNDSAKTMAAMVDETKSLVDRYRLVAEIAQHTADLWKQIAQKKLSAAPVSAA